MIEANSQNGNEIIDEESQLDEELDTLRAQLKHEKAWGQMQNQANRHKLQKLQQKLQAMRKEGASREKVWQSHVDKIKAALQAEKDDLAQKLQQARYLNERLKQKLHAPALVENKATNETLKFQVQALRSAMADEESQAHLHKIEAEQTYELLETLLSEAAIRTQNVKAFLLCKYKVATGVPHITPSLSKSTVFSKSQRHP